MNQTLIKPEQKGEDGERANIHPTASYGTEYSTEESDKEEDHSLPDTKVHYRVKSLPFMLPKMFLRHLKLENFS